MCSRSLTLRIATPRHGLTAWNRDAIPGFAAAGWFGALVIQVSIQFPNVVVWISIVLEDAIWLLGQPEHKGEHNKYWLRDK